jgi:hypothetical protein
MSFAPPTATGYSAFYSTAFARPGNGAAADYNAVPRYGRSSNERVAAFALGRGGFRGMRRAMRVLNGASAGSATSETYGRIAAQTPFAPETAGGARTVETVTVSPTGNTTTAQRDYINDKILDMLYDQEPGTYPTDASGNGGGGKRGI